MSLDIHQNTKPESFSGLNFQSVDPGVKTLTWHRLEEIRYRSLSLSNKYSRYFNVLRKSTVGDCGSRTMYQLSGVADPKAPSAGAAKPGLPGGGSVLSDDAKKANSIAPFATVGK